MAKVDLRKFNSTLSYLQDDPKPKRKPVKPEPALEGEVCRNCRYYKRQNPDNGRCCRESPRQVAGSDHRGVWPLVKSGDWCGQFMQI